MIGLAEVNSANGSGARDGLKCGGVGCGDARDAVLVEDGVVHGWALLRCGSNNAVIAIRLLRIVCAASWVRLAGVSAVSLVLIGSSSAVAIPTWSAADPIDPAIMADSVSCSSASFCVSVGYTRSFGSAAVYSDGTWSEASLIDLKEQLFSVSCTSSSFCMALDGSGGALIFNGSTWSTPTPTGTDLSRVSCVSSSFCVAVGGSGEAATYNGSTWSALSKVGVGVRSVSCASESFCMAVGSNGGGPAYAVIYNGSSWDAPTQINSEDNSGPSSVSCGSPSYCVAVGNFGDEETYNSGTWGTPTPVSREGAIESISCQSESFCMAVSGREAIVYNGSTWSATSKGATGVVSCPTQSFCVTVGGYAASYNGSIWTSPVPVGGGGLTSVSCSSPWLCTAVDFHGRVLSYNGSTWSAPILIDPEGSLDSVSCPSAGFCMAAGGQQHGHALTYNGSTWSTANDIDAEDEVASLSCVSASFCMAVTEYRVEGHEHGYALIYTGGAWSAPVEIDGEAALRSVSCASESFCVAVGGHDAAIYTGGGWGTPSEIDTEGYLEGVSCPSSSFCVATVDHYSSPWTIGEALTYNGSAWSLPSEIPRDPDNEPFDVGPVSCVSSSFCMAAARSEGAAATFESSTWSAWTPLELNGAINSVSCPAVSFCVMVNEVGQAFTYGTPPPSGPGGSSGVLASAHGTPATNPPVKKRKPLVNGKTGEITLEYEFPEPGTADAYGEVIDNATVDAKHKQTKTCKKRATGKRKECIDSVPMRYGRSTLAIATAGSYKLHIKPSQKVLAALKNGKTLQIRVTVIFTPSGTTSYIPETTTVSVHLKKAHQSTHHAKGKLNYRFVVAVA
jgi:hypothetical protein